MREIIRRAGGGFLLILLMVFSFLGLLSMLTLVGTVYVGGSWFTICTVGGGIFGAAISSLLVFSTIVGYFGTRYKERKRVRKTMPHL